MKAALLSVGVVLLGTVAVARHFWMSVDAASAADASPRRLAEEETECPPPGKAEVVGNPEEGLKEELKDKAHVDDVPKTVTLPKFLACVFGMFYMFVALYIACDELFVPSLEVISDKLKLSPDVAGATFMAAGGSAPEFFTSLVGSFKPEPSSVGISAIVGSAIFNVLFVIAACGVVAPGTLQLTGYPLARDSIFYLVDLVLLMVFFGFVSPGLVELWEAAVLFALYLVYCIFMRYSSDVEDRLASWGDERRFNRLDKNHDGQLTQAELAGDAELTQGLKDGDADTNHDGKLSKQEVRVYLKSRRNMLKAAKEQEEAVGEDEENHPLSLCFPADAGVGGYLWHIFTFPLIFVLMFTVPDVRREGCWKNLYLLTFILSICWIAVFSYVMVFCTDVVGKFTGISTDILALTLLAWGTSVPDLLTSILVTLQHRGDMAVSSSIGSNIFDVTVGLPVPFLLRIVVYGCPYPVGANGIVSSIGLLVLMLGVTIGSIMANGWVLNKCLGIMMFVLWGVIQVWTMYQSLYG